METLLRGGQDWAVELGWDINLPMCSKATSWNASLVATADWLAADCSMALGNNIL